MNTTRVPRLPWLLAGLLAGAAGLATSYLVAMTLTVRGSPLVAVADEVIRLTPGVVVEHATALLGSKDKPVLMGVILLLLALLFMYAGWLAARRWWLPFVVFTVLAAVGALAVSREPHVVFRDFWPVLAGWLAWVLVFAVLWWLIAGPSTSSRTVGEQAEEAGDGRPVDAVPRRFVLAGSVVALASLVTAAAGRSIGISRHRVEETIRLLRLPGVSKPTAPAATRIGIRGTTPWQTSADAFYRIDTALSVPTIEPREWRLRIHGQVERELVLSYRDLIDRDRTEGWVTLNCVSNPVGGPLIGNAWWSGVLLKDLLAEAEPREGADAVLQTSDDGWSCGTPLSAMVDGRGSMLALAMNGEPLPLEHGFPVRTVVPGLYGYVSACKWLVDLEVTRFSDIAAYWTERGWAEQGPVKISSRIDVPRADADVAAGRVDVAGVAWHQHTGIARVEVSLDGGGWQPVRVASSPSIDTWVQWGGQLDVSPGDHLLRVRAVGRDGQTQTGVVRDVLPDGATGWHTVAFTAS